MTYDYKRLCNELLSYLYQCDWPDGERFYALTERARTALAEPDPPNRKEQALEDLDLITGYLKETGSGNYSSLWCKTEVDTIRRELEALPE